MQPPFVGPSYDLESRPASVQRTINLVPVMLEPGNERAGWAFEDVPGFVVFGVAPGLFLTSKPYPVMFEDGMDFSHAQTGGGMWTWDVGEVDLTHAFVGGELRDVLLVYEGEPEEIDVVHAFLDGELRTVLLTYEIPREDIDIVHALLGGDLKIVLLTYSNWPREDVDVSHAFIGGALA